MSSKIDERIARMTFENDQFEKAIAASSKSLSNFDSQVAKSGNSAAFGGLAGVVEGVGSKFSALETIGVGALMRIGQQAADLGTNLVKSLTIDGAQAGFQEYELKINSIRTILASAKDENGMAVSLEEVNKQLNELNEYSDQTIYSFSDMTQNIGKFTNAGIDLDTSVNAIKGIANAAALSGANSNEASRAMYNFSQALSKGNVQLIDWKSIELANMATVEFKEQLLESAVAAGTLTKTGDGMYKTLGANGKTISATSMFNDSLKDAWLTTDALMMTLNDYADANTEIGARATEAATKIRTFSQVIDTAKEAIGSGWAQSMETIFGDFDEATELWTGLGNVIGDFVQKSSDARNKILDDWDALGGRTAVIDGIKAAWEGLQKILDPIKNAFEAVFPPATGKTLADISTKFRDLMEAFQPSQKQISLVYNAFKGLFNGLALGWDAVKFVFDALKIVIQAVLPEGDGLLQMAAKVGDFFTNLKKSADRGDVFAKALDAIREVINKTKDVISTFVTNFQSGLEKLEPILKAVGDAFTWLISPLTNLSNAFKKNSAAEELLEMADGFDKLEKKTSGLEAFINKVKEIFSGIKEFLAPVGEFFGQFFGAIKDYLASKWETEGLTGFFNLLNTIFTGGLLVGINKFIDSITEITKNTSINGVFDTLKDTLKTYQMQIKASTILKIAGAVAILAASIISLSLVEPDRLMSGVTAITFLFAELAAAFTILQKTSGGNINKIGIQLMEMAGAVKILASALEDISKVPTEKLMSSVTALGAIMAELVAVSKLMQNAKGFQGAALALIELSLAIRIVVESVEPLGQMDAKQLNQGLIAVGEIAAGMAAFAVIISKLGNGATLLAAGAALILVGAALLEMTAAVKILGSMNPGQLADGLLALGILLAEITVFATTLSRTVKPAALAACAVSLVAIGVAILEMVGAVAILGQLDAGALSDGLLALGIILAEIAAFSILITNTINPVNMLAAGAAMVAMGLAILEMAGSVAVLGSLNPDKFIQGMTGLAGGVTVMVAALILTSNPAVLAGAAAMVVMAASIAVLVPSIAILGAVPMGVIALALGALIAVFITVGVAAVAMAPLAPAILVLAAALGVLGIAMAAIGGGVAALGVGLALIAAAGVGAIALLSTAVKEMALLLPFILEQFGLGIIALCDIIIQGAPKIAQAVIAILQNIEVLLVTEIPRFIEIVLLFVERLLNDLVIMVPRFTEAGMKIILGFLQGVNEYLDDIVEEVVGILIAILEGINNKLDDLIDAGADIIISLIEGIGRTIPRVLDAIGKMIEDIMASIGRLGGSLFVAGANAIGELLKGIGGGISKVITEFASMVTTIMDTLGTEIPKLMDKGVEMVENIAKGISDSVPKLVDVGFNLVIDLINGVAESIRTNTPLVLEAIEDLVFSLFDGIAIFFGADAGSKVVSDFFAGLREGIGKFAGGVIEAVGNFFSNLVQGVKDLLGINSPSTVMADIGGNMMDGVTEGVKNNEQSVFSKMVDFAGGLITSLQDKMRNLPQTAKKWMDDISGGIRSGQQILQSAVSDIGYSIRTALQGIGNSMYTVGTSIVSGLSQGITSMVNSVANTAKNLANKVVDTAKSVFQTHSPSKVFQEIGQFIGEGLAIGINDEASLASDAIENTGLQAYDVMQEIIKSLMDSLKSDLNVYPTITPVVDMSQAGEKMQMLQELMAKSVSLDIEKTSAIRDQQLKMEAQNGSGSSTAESQTQINNYFTLQDVTIREEADINKIAQQLYQKQQTTMRGRGMRTTFA